MCLSFGSGFLRREKVLFGCSLWRRDSKVKLGVVNHSSVKMKLLHFHLSCGVWRSQSCRAFFGGERVFWFLSCWYSQGTSYQFFLIFVDCLRSHIIPSISRNRLLFFFFSSLYDLISFGLRISFSFETFIRSINLPIFPGDYLLDSFHDILFPLDIFIFFPWKSSQLTSLFFFSIMERVSNSPEAFEWEMWKMSCKIWLLG